MTRDFAGGSSEGPTEGPVAPFMLGRALTLNMVGQVGVLMVGFGASILLARLLGPSDRGLLAIELSVASLAFAIVAMGLPIAVEYYAGRGESSGAFSADSTRKRY